MANKTGYKYVVKNKDLFNAQVNRKDLTFTVSGFKTAKEAHECAVGLIKKHNSVPNLLRPTGPQTHEEFLANKKEVDGKLVIRYLCKGCGHNHVKKPEICFKCYGITFEKKELPERLLIQPEPEPEPYDYWDAI